MNEWLVRAARLVSLLMLALTFFVAASLRTTSLGTALLMSVTGVVATALMLWQGASPREWWFSAGLWGGLSYISENVFGLVYLVGAALVAFSAFQTERAQGKFEFVGPLAFIGALVVVVIVRGMIQP